MTVIQMRRGENKFSWFHNRVWFALRSVVHAIRLLRRGSGSPRSGNESSGGQGGGGLRDKKAAIHGKVLSGGVRVIMIPREKIVPQPFLGQVCASHFGAPW